ncbi:unnamed protein product, partial [Ectocarpus sp. 13 AM-2016]
KERGTKKNHVTPLLIENIGQYSTLFNTNSQEPITTSEHVTPVGTSIKNSHSNTLTFNSRRQRLVCKYTKQSLKKQSPTTQNGTHIRRDLHQRIPHRRSRVEKAGAAGSNLDTYLGYHHIYVT